MMWESRNIIKGEKRGKKRKRTENKWEVLNLVNKYIFVIR